MPELSPDQISNRTFRQAFRGFDPQEVAAFQTEVADMVEGLVSEQSRLRARLEELGDRNLRSEFETVSREVGEVLERARIAADGMRERAATEVELWRIDAQSEAKEVRDSAYRDAEAMRGDAWATSERLLEDSVQEARQQTEIAKKESLAITGQAERDSHRMLASARRESEEMTRTAKMEVDRLLVAARTQHDEIIDTARKAAEAAQERARALEVRREGLLAELETVRSKIETMESEIEQKAIPPSSDTTTVRVVGPPGEKKASGWVPDESVRIIPARSPAAIEAEAVDAASIADEVRRIRDQRKADQPSTETVEPEVAQDPVAEPAIPDVESVLQDVEEVEESEPNPAEPQVDLSQPAEPEPVQPAEEHSEDTGEIDNLFATLRVVDEAPTENPKPVAAVPVAEEALEPVKVEVDTSGDVIELRDRLLLPVTNRVLRSVKRQLTEKQNIALEALRVDGKWSADVDAIAEGIQGDLLIVVQESFAAGHTAVEEITGCASGRPRPGEGDIPDYSSEFGSALVGALEASYGAVSDDQGPRARSAALSGAFRSWRTDEAERRLRTYSIRGYHRGVLAAAQVCEVAQLGWIVGGRGCAQCRELGELGPIDIGEFTAKLGVPPAHDRCTCTLKPA